MQFWNLTVPILSPFVPICIGLQQLLSPICPQRSIGVGMAAKFGRHFDWRVWAADLVHVTPKLRQMF